MGGRLVLREGDGQESAATGSDCVLQGVQGMPISTHGHISCKSSANSKCGLAGVHIHINVSELCCCCCCFCCRRCCASKCRAPPFELEVLEGVLMVATGVDNNSTAAAAKETDPRLLPFPLLRCSRVQQN